MAVDLPLLIPSGEREALRQHVMGATRERMLRELADAVEAITIEAPLMIVLKICTGATTRRWI